MQAVLDFLLLIFITPIETVMKLILEISIDSLGSMGVSIILLSLITNIAIHPLSQLAEKWLEQERNISLGIITCIFLRFINRQFIGFGATKKEENNTKTNGFQFLAPRIKV